jgi:cytochrome c-type biogenesis protein CcmH/NrfG
MAAGEYQRALELYQQTDYRNALKALEGVPKDPSVWALTGRIHFMLSDFKRSRDAFEKAVSGAPKSSEYYLWLGRALGRQAETSSFLSAPGLATKARDAFEKAVQLDPNNKEALSDLFDYYLQAPGFLGGGLDKASVLASRIAQLDTAEGYYARAQLAQARKEYDSAEASLRRAVELAPRQVGRVLDLAKYLAKRGRTAESDRVFEQAAKMAPDQPKVLFEWASVLVREKRNLTQAKALLTKYAAAPLTPDDPPREEALKLLRQLGS